MSEPRPGDLSRYLARPSEAEIEVGRFFGPQEELVIFDIGSCEGEDSIRFSRHFPRARLFAFEPLPDNQRLIAQNLARYEASRIEVVPLALSDRAGEAEFHVSSGSPREEFSGPDWNYGNKSSSLLPPASDQPMFGWIDFKRKIPVRCETLDGFCAARGLDRVDFIHMDVQGAESLVLAGAGRMLARVGAIWLEVADREFYRGQKLRGDIEAILRAQGFLLAHAVSRGEEGDQFYVNGGIGRLRRRLTLLRWGRRLRRALGAVRRRLHSPPPPSP